MEISEVNDSHSRSLLDLSNPMELEGMLRGNYPWAFHTVDVAVAAVVEAAVTKARMHLPSSKVNPLAVWDGNGHTNYPGYVIQLGEATPLQNEFFHEYKNPLTQDGVVARISFGGKLNEHTGEIDQEDLARFHVSVTGYRGYFPIHWKPQGLGKEDFVQEKLHFSLRFLMDKNGVLQYQNNDKLNPAEFACGFSETRTNHCGAYNVDSPFNKREENLIAEPATISRIINKIGRQDRILPFVIERPTYDSLFEGWNEINKHSYPSPMPVVGWSQVGSAVSQGLNYNHQADFASFPGSFHLNPETAVELLFDKVLPEMKKYVAIKKIKSRR